MWRDERSKGELPGSLASILKLDVYWEFDVDPDTDTMAISLNGDDLVGGGGRSRHGTLVK